MAYQLPTIPDFKGQFARDFPYATPLAVSGVVGAEASASLGSGGSVSALSLDSAGSGLTTAPDVVIYGGGGIGATGTATIAGGSVTVLSVVKAGYGFRSAPQVYLSLGGSNSCTDKVTDWDLVRAFTAAEQFNITQGIFSSQAGFTYAMDLLAAHYLCETLQAAGVGLGGKSEWLTKSKDVGNVAEQYEIPARILNSPYLAKLSKTTYGAQFLELVSPQLIGNYQSFHRRTLP